MELELYILVLAHLAKGKREEGHRGKKIYSLPSVAAMINISLLWEGIGQWLFTSVWFNANMRLRLRQRPDSMETVKVVILEY